MTYVRNSSSSSSVVVVVVEVVIVVVVAVIVVVVVVVVMVVCSEPCPPLEKFNTLAQYWFRSIATLHTNVVVIYVTDHATAARQLCKYLCNGPY